MVNQSEKTYLMTENIDYFIYEHLNPKAAMLAPEMRHDYTKETLGGDDMVWDYTSE